MITVYGYPNTRSLRVCWMLEELAQPYEYSLVDFSKGESQSPQFLAVNPAGKVPVITDGDLLLTESAAIITYLGDKLGNGDLVPKAGTPQRGHYDQWCHFAMCELEQPLWTRAKHKFALPSEHRIKEIFPTADWELQKALNLFSQGLGKKDYILGDAFSAADILLGQTLQWAISFKQQVPQQNLQDYSQRLRNRPALLKAQQREKTEAGI
ncbi:glutathione S-transferase family protein [Oceanicoccus sp. KOV_DT_Chl]|uniref:glutathione S-transferase family protein n=1 Tax=Oceanicoccus sp. KOV_DT_Chl TaxID=1904639 RepID=UPI000C7A5575|nr:glutathione S-transferase family protein [Oceanicoccus sp. KOV_DT_Chl]